jgi:hypothetical protein
MFALYSKKFMSETNTQNPPHKKMISLQKSFLMINSFHSSDKRYLLKFQLTRIDR